MRTTNAAPVRNRLSYVVFVFLLVAPVVFATGVTEEPEVDAGSSPVVITDARGEEIEVPDASRVVSLGAAVSETVAALGAADRLVGVDQSSSYPEEALAGIPRTGYVREVSAEGILSLSPTLVLASVDTGPPEVIAQIEEAGVPVAIVPEDDSLSGAAGRVEFVATLLGTEEAADSVIAGMETDESRLVRMISDAPADERPSVVFVYARGAGTVLVSGDATSADAMIELAGGRNALEGFTGYRPLTPEAAIAAEPDYLLFTTSGLGSLGGPEGLAAIPGIAQTRAYAENRIIAFDDTYLLSFGPRTASAAYDLARALYGE